MQKKVVVLVDDRDGSRLPGEQFHSHSKAYRMKLIFPRLRMRSNLSATARPWISAARRVGGRLNSRRSCAVWRCRSEVRVRRWAREKKEVERAIAVSSSAIEQFEGKSLIFFRIPSIFCGVFLRNSPAFMSYSIRFVSSGQFRDLYRFRLTLYALK